MKWVKLYKDSMKIWVIYGECADWGQVVVIRSLGKLEQDNGSYDGSCDRVCWQSFQFWEVMMLHEADVIQICL